MISDHVKTIAESWRQHRIPRLSAGLAYYTMFALAPIMVILIAAAGTFLGEAEAQKRLIQEAGSEYTSSMGISIDRCDRGIIS